MKHRVFRYLVENHGFTTFGIEASWPEALDVDRYVRTGEGDPADLVRRMFFWTWSTEEVVDLVRWMREYNREAGTTRLRFVGFDMQFPAASIDSVESFVRRVDTASVTPVRAGYACLDPFRNTAQRSPDQAGYRALSGPAQQACREAIAAVRELFALHATSWAARSTPGEFAHAAQHARLVQQWEEMAKSATLGGLARDRAMAENAAWWLNEGGASHRMMLWAHNYHVSGRASAMGGHLRTRYGSDYVPVGFAFGAGSFNAVTQLPNGSFAGLGVNSVPAPVPGSVESLFATTGAPRLFFDARRIDGGGAAAQPLRARTTIREIGSVFASSAPTNAYQSPVALPSGYAILIWFANTTATRLLSSGGNSRPPAPLHSIASEP
jgi:erythromycin esterase